MRYYALRTWSELYARRLPAITIWPARWACTVPWEWCVPCGLWKYYI
jgi:hypothetical protein